MTYLNSNKIGASAIAGLMMAVMSGALVAKDVEDPRSLDAFSRIVIKGAADIDVEVGKDQNVVVKTDGKYLEHVTTVVKDGTLYIDTEHEKGWAFWKKTDIDVSVEVPVLESFGIKGAADGRLSGLTGQDFELDIKGAGDVHLEGDCKNFDLYISGAGDVDAKDFKCLAAEVRVKGAGDAEVHASESVKVIISGAGDVSVYGKPETVEKSIRGVGDIDIN